MQKVMRYQIIKPLEIDWSFFGDILRTIQKETQAALNKTIQLCWEWQGFSAEYKERYGMYPNSREVLGYTSLQGYAYDRLKDDCWRMNTANLAQTIKRATDKWRADLKEILLGERSIPNFKKNVPIDIVSKAIKLDKHDGEYILSLGLLSTKYKEELGRNNGQIEVVIAVRDKTQRIILDGVLEGTIKIGASQILHDLRKRKWYINLTYRTEKAERPINKENIMGVNLGIKYPVYIAFNHTLQRYKIKGGEIERFRRQIESRRKELLEQGKYCGDGRKGHGRKKRIQPIEQIVKKIENFRKTTNHKYSRYIVDLAIKHGCGTIQMKDLSEISKDNTFLKRWSYYDLKQKIEYKAKEYGIDVVYVKPDFISQRCSKCGYIDHENRENQAEFICKSCGFKTNADYNAARNLAIKGIDRIMEKELIKLPI